MALRLAPLTQNAIAAMHREHPEALLCRERGQRHAWDWKGDFTPKRGSGYDRKYTCTRCRSDKYLSYNYRGAYQKTRYEYSEGYRLPPGVGRLDGDAVHRATKDLFLEIELQRSTTEQRRNRKPRASRRLKVGV